MTTRLGKGKYEYRTFYITKNNSVWDIELIHFYKLTESQNQYWEKLKETKQLPAKTLKTAKELIDQIWLK